MGSVKSFREKTGMSQAALADQLGVSQATVAKVENGTRRLPDHASSKFIDLEEELRERDLIPLPGLHEFTPTPNLQVKMGRHGRNYGIRTRNAISHLQNALEKHHQMKVSYKETINLLKKTDKKSMKFKDIECKAYKLNKRIRKSADSTIPRLMASAWKNYTNAVSWTTFLEFIGQSPSKRKRSAFLSQFPLDLNGVPKDRKKLRATKQQLLLPPKREK